MTAASDLALPSSPRTDLSATLPWLKPLTAAVVLLLALLSLLDLAVALLLQSMPPSHFVAGPIAVGLMVVIWFAELGGLRWPRLIFVGLVTAPNFWLAAIGHTSVNFLFLSLTVAWVAANGNRTESWASLALNLAVVGISALVGIANGQVAVGAWIPWALGLVLVWLMTRALVFQQRLTAELRAAQSDIYDQARQTALLEERQRLARELHDAVTQTLFASSLIADVLPHLWERDPAEGRRRLAELRELTRGALAEMRALLYELRPAALAEMPLGDLLRQLTEATTGRARMPVSLAVQGQRRLPAEVQVAFYRIAQEALNNVAKHAGAARADLLLVYRANEVELCLQDDGQGFDVGQIPPGHLGIGIMRERAAAAGAALAIDSRPGRGTRLTVTWPQSGRSAGHGGWKPDPRPDCG